MFLFTFNNNQKIAFLKIAQQFSRFDNVYDKKEAERIELLRREMGIDILPPITGFELKEELSYFMGRKEQIQLLIEILNLGYIDGDYCRHEEEFINKIADFYGISREELNHFEEWVVMKLDLVEKAKKFWEEPDKQVDVQILEDNYKDNIQKIKELSTATEKEGILRSKILVLGAKGVAKKDLIGVVKKLGVDSNMIEFRLDYKKNVSFNLKTLRYSEQYCGILIGPIAHSVIGVGDNTSVIQMLLKEEGYPPFVEIRTESGQLKITKSGFRISLIKLLLKLGVETEVITN